MRTNPPQSFQVTRRQALSMGAVGGLAFATAPLLAACSSGPSSSGSTSIKVGSPIDIVNYDPYNQSVSSLIILRNLNCWLLNYDENLRPQPDALQSYTIAPDRASVSLKIRTDVKFVTGKKMTVDDVVAAFARARDPKLGLNLASPSKIIADVKATTAEDVVVTFAGPTATTLITDLLVGQPVVDASKNDAASLAKAPAGAAPFIVSDRSQGSSLTLVANPDWYGGKLHIDKVTIQVFPTPQAQQSALQSGAIDIAAYLSPSVATAVDTNTFDVLQGFPGAAIQLVRVSTLSAPFDNKLVRQAIMHSINRERIVKEALNGFGGAALLPWGAKSPAYSKDAAAATAYDLDKAKSLLASAGTTGGGTALVSGSDTVGQNALQIIQNDLKSIGFDLQIEKVDQAAFDARLPTGKFGIALGQMGGGQLSPARVVQNSLLRTSNNPLWPDGNPPQDYVDGMNILSTQDDSPTRSAAYTKVNSALVEGAWANAAYYTPTIFASTKKLHGVARDHQNALVLANVKRQ